MSTRHSTRNLSAGRIVRRSLVSGFVLFSYIAYAIHEHGAAPAQTVAAVPPSPQGGQAAQPDSPAVQPQDQSAPASSAQDPATPTAPPQAGNTGQYKNGTFTGINANAFYGQVQVQVVINNGRIASVNFLNYPQDRRTSARINSFAVPALQSEAIQAQSARVDVISGATLTSEAFMASLQSALNNARG